MPAPTEQHPPMKSAEMNAVPEPNQPEGMSLAEAEEALFAAGSEKINRPKSESPETSAPLSELKTAMDAKVDGAAEEFSKGTETWWSKVKNTFRSAMERVGNRPEIDKLDEQLEAIKKIYQNTADGAVAKEADHAKKANEKENAGAGAAEKNPEGEAKAVLRVFEELRKKGDPRAREMADVFAKYRDKIGHIDDKHGQIGDVRFEEQLGQIRVEYADGTSLRIFANSLVLRVHENGKIEVLDGPFSVKKRGSAPDLRSVGKPPLEPESSRIVPNWEKDTLLAEKGLRDLEAAKTAAELRAFIVRENILSAEELARLTDAEVESRREAIKDEIAAVGGVVAEWIGDSASMADLTETMNQAARSPQTQEQNASEASGTDADPILLTPNMRKGGGDADETEIVSESPDKERLAALGKDGISDGVPENIAFADTVLNDSLPTAENLAATKAEDKEVFDLQKNPLDPKAMPAILIALKGAGKKRDGNFATPAGFREALEKAGFEFSPVFEPEELKKLHETYKKMKRKGEKP